MADDEVHDPEACEHEQCGHAFEAGYIAGRKATAEDLRRLADSLDYDDPAPAGTGEGR